MTLALTGATGFVGKATVDHALARGHHVRALTRRDQPARDGVSWISGNLDSEDALARLASGADAVIHIAGVVNAPSPAGFITGNVHGTARMAAAAASVGVRRFVHLSSLSAREPHLSNYGRSKERAEDEVRKSGLDWTMIRPPGVYGPGDMEMRDVFRMAKLGFVILPPAGRISLIHVHDLARLLVAMAESDPGRHIYECDDGVDGGYSHAEFARLVGAAVGRRPVALHVPRALLHLAGRADRFLRDANAKLTPDRAAYLSHPDWTARPLERPPVALWAPQIATPDGLSQTADWYRSQRLL
ncbi:NAD-dependent epimerase/dehydratase family protein [Sphingomonas suaedae]|uniref:NAD-dependent epimerase/dehydratase family protein n=1 Tax=Sphingomonas suaedae TaxID=2599297 RepID=A0A518RLR8_9SPHN|nr:NAD(P)H-binding protein [Sphingomonas suaedae]QDX28388.1 NAD-dependent epimerase/dehydratase family protein [Sphingomonas suaedae]